MRSSSSLVFLGLLAACGPGMSEPIEADPDHLADGRTLVQRIEYPYRPKRVDLLFVIDDSPSMRHFQARWAENAVELAELIQHDTVSVDLRVAFTTTSVPGPTCTGPRAQGGAPIVESCLAHLDDFVGPGEHDESGPIEDLRAVCEDACSFTTIPRIPSPGHDEHDLDDLAQRPWIEAPHNRFGGNLDGIELAEALTCAGLQGFHGCEFEQPIEAAARMVERMADPSDPMAEFRRDDAMLMIVTISDEDDCSHPDANATIFDPAGERTFWPDPAADQPTSGICVRASVECDDQTCTLVDHDLDGQPTTDPSAAVLTPTTRLIDALAAAGELTTPANAIAWEPPSISILAGVTPAGAIDYTPPGPELEPDEQAFFDRFGVVPGCSDNQQPFDLPTLYAAPGGRLAEMFDLDERLSICEADWTPAFHRMGHVMKDILKYHCIESECVANLDPLGPLLVPDCVFEEVDVQGDRTTLPVCVRDDVGWVIDPQTQDVARPEGANQCWFWRTDPGGVTSTPVDDIDEGCALAGLVGGVSLATSPDTPAYLPYDSHYELRCRPCDG